MSLGALALLLSLAWYVGINAAASAVVASGVALARRVPGGHRVSPRGNVLFALRLAPAAVALASVTAGFLPAFLAYEPRDRAEPVTLPLLLMAAAAAALVAATVRRGLKLRRGSADLVGAWFAGATRLEMPAGGIDVYAVDDRVPTVSLVGVRRPRLFVARQVLDALSPGELALAVAHEIGHRDARDNLKRHVLCWTPDFLGLLPAGRRLERCWAAAAEQDADAAATGNAPTRRVELASALVKVSRLALPQPPPPGLFSALHESDDLSVRVSRLVALDRSREPRAVGSRPGLVAAAAGASLVAAMLPSAWPVMQHATEILLRLLS